MNEASIEASIYQHLQNARLDAAQELARQLVASNPDLHQGYYLLGLSLLLDDQASESIPCLQQALERFPLDARYFCNLGLAYLQTDRPDKAKEYLLKALELKADYPEASYNLGCCHVHLGDATAAKKIALSLNQASKGDARYISLLADAERLDRNWPRAFRLYARALLKDKTLVAAHLNLGVLKMHLGRHEKALEHFKAVLDINPKQAMAYTCLGDCYLAMEMPDDAMHAYADAYELQPGNPVLCVKIGNSWLGISDLREAGSWFERALQLDEHSLAAKVGIANVFRESQEESKALNLLLELEEEGRDNLEFLMALGEAHWDEGNVEEALACFRQAREREPQRIGLYSRIGRVLSSSGDVDGAIHEYQEALKINKNAIPALSGLAVTLKGKLDHQYAQSMLALLNKAKIKTGARSSLHNGLAFYFEGQKNYQLAAEHSRKANELQWQHKSKAEWDYSIESHHRHIQSIKDTFDQKYFASLGSLGHASETPVFVVSMPRSGTTLTEQILARHHQVLGIGERNYASRGFAAFRESLQLKTLTRESLLARLNPDIVNVFAQTHLRHLDHMLAKSGKENVIRVVDKMPDNYHQLGWLKTLFPKCKIIHIRRDPRDVALSCWMTQFGSIPWACHVDHLVDRIQSYQELMNHWRLVLAGDILEIHYEDLVANQEAVSRQMIDWLGLDWDENCLSFYESDRLVRTASITQVRQPIYQQSVKKWQHYLPYLPDLLEPLKA